MKKPGTKPSATRGGMLFVDIVRLLCAILLPPIGVFLTVGLGLHFWLNIVLTLFGFIPGIVHAIWIIASRAAIANGGR